MNPSTPKFIHTPSNVSWITSTILDFPDRGAPFRMMICPGARVCSMLPPLVPHAETAAQLAEIRYPHNHSRLICDSASRLFVHPPYLPRGVAGQSAPPVASMSRATAAVQDCSPEPSASPVNGSKYSAKPPSESSSRVSRRIIWAFSLSPARSSDHQNSQLATGQTG